MNFYALSALINGSISTILGIFIFSRNSRDMRYITYGLFSLSISVWSYFYFAWQITADRDIALFCCRALMAGAIFIPVCYLHYLFYLFRISDSRKKMVYYGYIGAFVFLTLDFTPFFVRDVVGRLSFRFWPVPGATYHTFLLLWLWYFGYSFFTIILEYRKATGFKKNQLRYVLLATFIGWAGISTNYPLWYNIPVSPLGNILVSGYLLILAFAILRYRLMDITVALTRTGIFVAVYSLVLGLPFALAIGFKSWLIVSLGVNWWTVPLVVMVVLATGGPFIYIYFEHKAEERLLKEQRRYQDTLKQASIGMTRIRNLRRLLDLIVHIVTKTVKISYAAVYIYDKDSDRYLLQVSRDKGRISLPQVSPQDPLIKWVVLKRTPLLYEEIRRLRDDTNSKLYRELEDGMRRLEASVVIPSYLEDKFIGFFILGDKLSGQIYTPDDLNVFQVLANQAALAIENAQFYEETKQMQEQIAQAEKMATIGTMADGLSHQINNRFHALSLIAGDTIDTIKLTDTSRCGADIKEMIKNISYALERIQANVMQGSEVVKGILKYTRKGEERFESIRLDRIIDATLDMAQYKIKLQEVDILRNYPKDIPAVRGNFVQLQEAFFNLIDNGYDATVERRELLKEDGYRGRIMISARAIAEAKLQIIVEDNGMGVKEANIKKIFTPFFTTKISSRRGTGLGLYVIKRIIADTHKGRIEFASTYGRGTRFIIELPLAEG